MVRMTAGAAGIDDAAVRMITTEYFFAGTTGKGAGIRPAPVDRGLFDAGGNLVQQLVDVKPLFAQQYVGGHVDFKEDRPIESCQQFP